MATNTPIGKGKVITADQFNELVSVYNTHWSDDIPTATFSELNSILLKSRIVMGGDSFIKPKKSFFSPMEWILWKYVSCLERIPN